MSIIYSIFIKYVILDLVEFAIFDIKIKDRENNVNNFLMDVLTFVVYSQNM